MQYSKLSKYDGNPHGQYLCGGYKSGFHMVFGITMGMNRTRFTSWPVFVFLKSGIHSKTSSAISCIVVVFNSSFRYMYKV